MGVRHSSVIERSFSTDSDAGWRTFVDIRRGHEENPGNDQPLASI